MQTATHVLWVVFFRRETLHLEKHLHKVSLYTARPLPRSHGVNDRHTGEGLFFLDWRVGKENGHSPFSIALFLESSPYQ